MFGCVRKVYNLALEARTEAWYSEQRRVNYNETSAMLTAWKREPELAFLNEVSSVPLQQSAAAPAGGVHELLREAREVPDVQEQEEVAGVGGVHPAAFR